MVTYRNEEYLLIWVIFLVVVAFDLPQIAFTKMKNDFFERDASFFFDGFVLFRVPIEIHRSKTCALKASCQFFL